MKKKKEMPNPVSFAQWSKAAVAWNRMYNNGRHGPYIFSHFIGLQDFQQDDFPVMHHAYLRVTDEAYNKIIMLNSPHAYALMKAFIARTGYHKKLPPVEVT